MNKSPSEENRKVALGLTIKKWVKEKLETAAEKADISMSKYAEQAIIEKLNREAGE
jgi:predicted HicB family RNase H-like nuclease